MKKKKKMKKPRAYDTDSDDEKPRKPVYKWKNDTKNKKPIKQKKKGPKYHKYNKITKLYEYDENKDKKFMDSVHGRTGKNEYKKTIRKILKTI